MCPARPMKRIYKNQKVTQPSQWEPVRQRIACPWAILLSMTQSNSLPPATSGLFRSLSAALQSALDVDNNGTMCRRFYYILENRRDSHRPSPKTDLVTSRVISYSHAGGLTRECVGSRRRKREKTRGQKYQRWPAGWWRPSPKIPHHAVSMREANLTNRRGRWREAGCNRPSPVPDIQSLIRRHKTRRKSLRTHHSRATISPRLDGRQETHPMQGRESIVPCHVVAPVAVRIYTPATVAAPCKRALLRSCVCQLSDPWPFAQRWSR